MSQQYAANREDLDPRSADAPRIGIVGGGPGGLYLAHRLTRLGIGRLTLLQAGGRLGGKAVTGRHGGLIYEAGVSELYDVEGDGWRRFLEAELGLRTLDLFGPHTIFDGVALSTHADMIAHFGNPSYERYVRFLDRATTLRPKGAFCRPPGPDDNENPLAKIPFASLLREIGDEQIERFVRISTNCDLATDPENATALWGLDNMFIDCPLIKGEYCGLYTIEGGIDRMVDPLVRQSHADIRLHSRVNAIRRVADGYELRCANGSTYCFDYVVLAMPVDRLVKIRFEGELEKAMVDYIAHYDKLGSYLRATLFFESPFWRKRVSGHFFQVDDFGGTTVYDDSLRYDNGDAGVASYLIAGSDADAMAERTDEEVLDLARRSLSAVAPPSRLMGGVVDRWIDTVNAQPGGSPIGDERERHIPDDRENPGLLIVGDFLFDSTVNGAFASASVVADLLAKRIAMQ